MRDTHDADLAEWRRLRHLRTLLEPLAYIFERTNVDCTGHCDRPQVIYQDKVTGEKITCCNLRPPWERYHEIRKLERHMNSKVNTGRKPFEPAKTRRVESPLKDAYPQSHTGTWVGKKIELKDLEDHPEGHHEETHEEKTKGKPKEH